MTVRMLLACCLAALALLSAAMAGCRAGEGRGPAPTGAGTQAAESATPPLPTAVPPSPTPEPTPIIVANLPIIDLHFHPEPGWAPLLPSLFDGLGVRMAGSGAAGDDEDALALASRFPGRVFAFAGGHHFRLLLSRHGERAWNLEDEEVERYLRAIEQGLRERRFLGIGEVHVNSRASNLLGTPSYYYPADAPLMRRLWALSAAHGVPLQVHMDADLESVRQMERLLDSDRRGVWLWAHTGHYVEPALLRRLLAEHPNLYCELSYRLTISGSRNGIPIDQAGRLRLEWRDLLEDFPDRFVIGTDLSTPSAALYRQHIGVWRQVLEQLTPETAAMLAYRNAERMLGLAP